MKGKIGIKPITKFDLRNSVFNAGEKFKISHSINIFVKRSKSYGYVLIMQSMRWEAI